MRRHLLTAAAFGLLGTLLLAADASACCHKRRAACTPACAPAPVPCAAPVQTCAPAPKRHGCCGARAHRGHRRGCHTRAQVAQCAPAPCASPVVYPTYQAYPTAQAAPAAQMVAPSKQLGY